MVIMSTVNPINQRATEENIEKSAAIGKDQFSFVLRAVCRSLSTEIPNVYAPT